MERELREESLHQAGALRHPHSAAAAPLFLFLEGAGGLATSRSSSLLGLLLLLGFDKPGFGDMPGSLDLEKANTRLFRVPPNLSLSSWCSLCALAPSTSFAKTSTATGLTCAKVVASKKNDRRKEKRLTVLGDAEGGREVGFWDAAHPLLLGRP